MMRHNLNRHPLRYEISWALVIKLILLLCLWLVFFRTPPHINPQTVAHALFAGAANTPPGR